MPDMSVKLAGVTLKNPVVVASGTFGFGREYSRFYDLGELGGICAKGLTLHPRTGNPAPRIAETPMGILNSVGLENPGVDAFIAEELPFLRKFDTKVIANISGNTPEEYGIMCEKLSGAGVDLIEVNISCPNVKAGGLAYGTRPELAAEVTEEAKRHANGVPVMVKLSPNVTDITEIAKAVEGAGGGADGLGGLPGGLPAHSGHGGRVKGGGRRSADAGRGQRHRRGHRSLRRPLCPAECPGRLGGHRREAGPGRCVGIDRRGTGVVKCLWSGYHPPALTEFHPCGRIVPAPTYN